jgi:hypothetical protein
MVREVDDGSTALRSDWRMSRCRVCDTEYSAITASHLAGHGMALSEYVRLYPGAEPGRKRRFLLTAEEADELFAKRRMSANAIAKLKGVHADLIRRELIWFGHRMSRCRTLLAGAAQSRAAMLVQCQETVGSGQPGAAADGHGDGWSEQRLSPGPDQTQSGGTIGLLNVRAHQRRR